MVEEVQEESVEQTVSQPEKEIEEAVRKMEEDRLNQPPEIDPEEATKE